MESPEYLPVAADALACFSVAFVETIEGVLLFVSIRKIVKSYRCREKGMEKEVVFYLLPAVAGVLVSVLVRLLMITVTDGVPVLSRQHLPGALKKGRQNKNETGNDRFRNNRGEAVNTVSPFFDFIYLTNKSLAASARICPIASS